VSARNGALYLLGFIYGILAIIYGMACKWPEVAVPVLFFAVLFAAYKYFRRKTALPLPKADMPVNSRSSADLASRLPSRAQWRALSAARTVRFPSGQLEARSSRVRSRSWFAWRLRISLSCSLISSARSGRRLGALLAQRCSDQRLDVGDGEAAECRAGALLAPVAASLGGKPWAPIVEGPLDQPLEVRRNVASGSSISSAQEPLANRP
jgi:hypothetical protein